MSLLDLLQEKAKTHRCRRCNKPLTDEESIELGIGPICRLKESLEYDDWWGVVEFCCMGGSGFSTTTKLNMITDMCIGMAIVLGMMFAWEWLVHTFPEAFMTHYDYGNNGAEREEE